MHVLCTWCRFVRIPWWSWHVYCKVCRTLRDEIRQHNIEEDIQFIAFVARARMTRDARREDYIPGLQRKVYFQEYDGPERRQREGTIFDRKGYIRNASFDPDYLLRRRDARRIVDHRNPASNR